FADLLVEDALVVELKCAERLANEHTAHCLNYLRASGLPVCLLVNFQKPKVEWKRIVLGFTDPALGTTTGTQGRKNLLSSQFWDTTLDFCLGVFFIGNWLARALVRHRYRDRRYHRARSIGNGSHNTSLTLAVEHAGGQGRE